MRKLFALLLVVVMVGCKSYNKIVDEKFGFKDLRLESSFGDIQSKVARLIKADDPYSDKYLVIDSAYYKFGDSELDGIILEFFDGQLESISCLGDSYYMESALQALYGSEVPSEINGKKSFGWGGKNAFVEYSDGDRLYRPITKVTDDDLIKDVESLTIFLKQSRSSIFRCGSMRIVSRRLLALDRRAFEEAKALEVEKRASDL